MYLQRGTGLTSLYLCNVHYACMYDIHIYLCTGFKCWFSTGIRIDKYKGSK